MYEDPVPPITNDIIDIPFESMFASADWRVIAREGENYYLACGEKVAEHPEGGNSTCIKPRFHKTWEHEDWDGQTRDQDFRQAQSLDDTIRDGARKTLLRTGLDSEQVYNALNALFFQGFRLVK